MVEQPVLFATIDTNSFSYCLLDKARMKMVLLKEYKTIEKVYPKYFHEVISKTMEIDEDLLNNVSNPFYLTLASNGSILIPSPLYDKEESKKSLELLTKIEVDDEVIEDTILQANAHHIFSVPSELIKKCRQIFKDFSIYHSNSAFIESQLRLNKLSSAKTVSVNVRTDQFEIIVTHGADLIFYNVFSFDTPEDFIYYILFTLEQLEINPDKTLVLFYGDINQTAATWMLVRKYIRDATFGELPEGLHFSYGFDQINHHEFYVLFSQYLCVL
jgi:hypothetical protein